jgi:hypothetical protein
MLIFDYRESPLKVCRPQMILQLLIFSDGSFFQKECILLVAEIRAMGLVKSCVRHNISLVPELYTHQCFIFVNNIHC